MYNKFSADFLFDGERLLNSEQVLITTEDGTIVSIVDARDAGEEIQYFHGCLCPGFVNAHCHLELSHMRGRLEAGSGMVPFLERVLFDRQAPDEVVLHAMHSACDEMTGNGIVAVGDIANLPISAMVKQEHGLYWHNFIEVSGFVPDNAARRFSQATATAAAFHRAFPAAQVSITPHAPYSVSGPLWQMVAHQHPGIMSIHSQESSAEDDFIRHASGDMLHLYKALGIDISFFPGTGQSSVHWWLPFISPGQALLLVHNCTTAAADVAAVKLVTSALSCCLCPQANMFIGNPLPDVLMLQEQGVNLCLGTDSLASNKGLNMISEIQVLEQAFALPPATLLAMATANGAKALQVEHLFGYLRPGMRPGVLLLEHFDIESLQQVTVQRLA